jgi:hypothetical protein
MPTNNQKPPRPADRPPNPRRRQKKTAPPAPNPWDRPPIPPLGDEFPDQIYRAVGWALSGWEMLEMSLVGLFDILIGTEQDSHASHRAYGAVTIWNIRRDMLKAAAEAYFWQFPDQALEREISEMINLADRYAARRNDVAHGIVLAYDEMFGPPSPLGGFRGWVLFPALTSTKSMRRAFHDPKYALLSEHITAFGQRFREISPRVEELIRSVGKRGASEPNDGSG